MPTSTLIFTRRLRQFWPLGPIFAMELRQTARRRRTYLLRFFYLGLLLAILSLAAQMMDTHGDETSLVAQAQQRAYLGHVFMGVFAIFSVVAMHLIAPVLTSTAVGNERLRRTLDALLMTPLSAWQIVGGKLFSRTLTAFSLIGLTLPVLAIVRLLGGVEYSTIFGAVALAAATAIGSAALGLLLSCFLRRAFAVILLSILIQGVVYGLFPVLFMAAFFSNGGRGSVANTIAVFQFIAALNPIWTASMKVVPSGMMWVEWWPAIAVQLGMATLLMLAATRVIRREARTVRTNPAFRPPPIEVPREVSPADFAAPPPLPGAVSGTVPPPLPALAAEVHAAPRRPSIHDNPVLWREIRRPLFNRLWQRVTAVTITLGLLGLCYLSVASAGEIGSTNPQEAFAFCMTAVLMLMAIVLSATAIATEKESDTWTTLIASPLSGGAIVWGKFRGVLSRLRWPMVLIAAHFTLFALAGVISFPTLLIILWTAAIFTLPWIATGLYFSLRCARPTTAVVFNLLLPLIGYAAVPLVVNAVQTAVQHDRYRYASRDYAEIVLYYLPFYYQSMAIERLSRVTNSYGWEFQLPMRMGDVSASFLLPMAFVAGLFLLLVTALMLYLLSQRFDRIVGRARTRSLAE